MKIYIETYGCAANQNDTEILKAKLGRDSKFVDDIEDADEIIINTCIVKQPTENKLLFRIRELHEKFPEKKFFIAGCLAKTNRVPEFCEVLNTVDVEKVCTPLVRKNPKLDIIQISRGCLGSCAYCGTKKARGALVSSPPEKIIERMKKSLAEGVREFRFTSQDCGCYGYDLTPRMNLAVLLRTVLDSIDKMKALGEISFQKNVNEKNRPMAKDISSEGRRCEPYTSHREWNSEPKIRIGMMNPNHVKDFYKELIEVYKDPRIVKFLHIPVQSGSDSVLKGMGRGYSVSDFVEIVEKMRRQILGLVVWTDIIVGFPGETDQDFEASCKLLRSIRPDFVNVSKFGVRPGTAAAGMKQLPTQIVKERSVRMSEMVKDIRKNNQHL